MIRQPLKTSPETTLEDPRPVESVIRNTLLIGFLILLLVVVALGYLSRASFETLDQEIKVYHASEANHLRIILSIATVVGRMETEARNFLAQQPGGLLHFRSGQHLEELKREIDGHLASGRVSSLADAEEWKGFENDFREYWGSVRSDNREVWAAADGRMRQALRGLHELVEKERQEHDTLTAELSARQRNRIATATTAALGLGLVIGWLTVYEIRRILNRLNGAYKKTAESRGYLQSLFDSMVSGVLVIDRSGHIESAGRSFGEIVGRDLNEIAGVEFRSLFANKLFLVESVARGLESRTDGSRYFGRVDFDGGRIFDVFASPLVIGDEHRGLILIFVDVTDADRAMAELRRNRTLSALGQMTAQIAHEIKNPLGSIRFATEVLKRKAVKETERETETIAVIDRSVDHLAAIVSELSEVARPKELKRSDVRLKDLLEGLIPMVMDRLNAKQVQIKRDYREDNVSGSYDETELRKLFLNLIINAIDASAPGNVVKLSAFREGANAVVEVQDHGSGMDQETLRRLFEPFYTTKASGTGLGMAIAKKITELHSGDLEVISEKGKGTTITVRLPLN